MSVLPVGIGADSAAGSYQIERSLRFNSADSAYLNRTPASTGNRKTWTWSGWVKLSGSISGNTALFVGGSSGSNFCSIAIDGNNNISLFWYVSSSVVANVTTSAKLRDPSAWYHLQIAVDTTQATDSNRMIVYLNGIQQTSFVSTIYPTQNYDGLINNTNAHYLGQFSSAGYNNFDGYLTEINFIDGSALDPTSFGEYNEDTGVWQPKAYTGSYGTNGFYLNFSDNSGVTSTTLGADSSGNGNNWTPNNFSVTAGAGNDSLVDTPTNYGTDTGVGGEVRGNYATWNGVSIGADATLTNGNLDIAYGSSVTRNATMGTFGMSSGKWYWEVTITASSASPTAAVIGITNEPSAPAVTAYPGFAANGWGYVGDGDKYNNGSGTAYGATFAANDVIGFAFDADAGSITAYKNGVSQGVMFSGLAANTYYPAIGDGSGASTFSASANFGQRPFAYTAPSGFKALCTQNLPEPTIVDGGEYFDVLTYTGDGSTSRSITGLSFAPDFVWNKTRSNADDHRLVDVVRGGGTDLSSSVLYSNLTNAQDNASGYITQTSNGFDLGVSATPLNMSGRTYVAWNWKASGSGVSNTDGTITSTVSANTDSGFSIVTYTGNGTGGATVGHGLGVAPSMIIVKNRTDGTRNWLVYHASIGNTAAVFLDLTNGSTTASAYWNNTSPTSTVFSLGNSSAGNGSTNNLVAYCFAAIPSFSAMGSYLGNGSADGPFVYTGFRPAFVMVKNSSATADWILVDTVRQTYNVVGNYFRPNTSNAEQSAGLLDIVSNGFKLRTDSSSVTVNALNTYIYAAFAENPFKYSLAR